MNEPKKNAEYDSIETNDTASQPKQAKSKKHKKVSKTLTNLFAVLTLLIGAGLLLYPTVSDLWNSYHTSRAISGYQDIVNTVPETDYSGYLESAEEYNERLRDIPFARRFAPTEAESEEYNSILDIDGNGLIGYIEIPSINVKLPIYHGTSDDVLQAGAGHLEGSSFPIGGPGTHTVISGHRGLTSAQLFTHLDRLKVGDIFFINVLKETLAYQVDQINVVLPEELESCDIEDGQDYCTLVTCTPYGVNTHRLLVRGSRTEIQPSATDGNGKNQTLPQEAGGRTPIDTRWIIVIGGISITAIFIFLILRPRPAKKYRNKKE